MFRSLSAEILKLKSSRIGWVLIVCALLTILFVFIGHLLDVHNIIRLNENPWSRYANATLTIYALFVITTLAVLVTSFIGNIEHKSNGWKFVYTMPVTRFSIYSAKPLLILLLLLFNFLLLVLCIWISGYLVNTILPEYEFDYFKAPWLAIFQKGLHAIISVLGVLGIQYFLTIRFKNFLVPLGVGIFGMIFGFILTSINTKFILFCPYSYPMIAQDLRAFPTDFRSFPFDGWLSNVEYLSISVFIICFIVGYLLERKRPIV